MSAAVRVAAARGEDAAAIEAYLATRSDTCMILRSNLRAAGLAWDAPPARYQAQYAVVWRGDAVVGVAGHAWNDMLLVQADAAAGAVARHAVTCSGRPVAGLMGAVEQVVEARAALGLAAAAEVTAEEETLMSLALAELIVPAPLADGRLRARTAGPADRDLQVAWRIAYQLEAMGAAPGPANDRRAEGGIDAGIAEGRLWLLEDGDDAVASTTFNARLPDAVQVGGVWTPPALRGRGYARAVVAAQLLDARARGATRAVLFTPFPDALRAYLALGFAPIGRYGFVLFRR